MTSVTPSTYDLRWRRGNTAALLALCLAASVAMGHRGRSSRPIGPTVGIQPARVAAACERIDPNTAPIGSLRRLGGIGPALAGAIVEYRRQYFARHGRNAFRSPADLANVPRIGPGIVRRIAGELSLPGDAER